MFGLKVAVSDAIFSSLSKIYGKRASYEQVLRHVSFPVEQDVAVGMMVQGLPHSLRITDLLTGSAVVAAAVPQTHRQYKDQQGQDR